jgi:nucleolar protein 14
MPYVLECPTSLPHYMELVGKYARSPGDVTEMIRRITAYYAIRLDAANRSRMHNLYDIMMRRLVELGEESADRGTSARNEHGGLRSAQVEEMNALAETIISLTPDMSDVAASLWVRMLRMLHSRLEKRLRDYERGAARSCFPGTGPLVLLRLLPDVFPASDYRHPVMTPAFLFIGEALAQCPVASIADVKSGLLWATLMFQYSEAGERVPSEAWAFLTAMLMVLASGASSDERGLLPTFNRRLVESLRTGMSQVLSEGYSMPERLSPYLFLEDLKPSDWSDAALTALGVSCRLVKRVADGQFRASWCALKVLEPCLESLKGINIQGPVGWLLESAHGALQAAISEVSGERTPLSWRASKAQGIVSLAPRAAEGYLHKRDSDLDKGSAKIRQLQRQVRREKIGAMRELRRDAAYMAVVKATEGNERADRRKKQVAENMAWLQDQQATLNQQVKLHKGDGLRGGGSGGVKKRR